MSLDKTITERGYLYGRLLAVAELLEKEAASVKVLSTSDKWIGITYKEDIEPAQESFSQMITAGCYPENLWI